jgi:flagellar basal body rod protein FlgG
MTNSIASLNAHSGWLDNSAANVAGTTNRAPSRRESTITSQNGATALHTSTTAKAPDMTKEMTDQLIIPKASEANAAAIKTASDMKGTLLNLLA